MKVRLLPLIIIMLSAVVTLVSCDDPGVVFEFETFDFGAVEQEKSLQAVFAFRNAGKRTLVIERVQPT